MLKPQASNVSDEKKNEVVVVKWEKSSELTQEEAEARLHQEGYSVFCWNDVAGAAYPKHRHESDECLWILKGELKITIQEILYILSPGDRIYLPANTLHTAEAPNPRGVTYLVGKKEG